MLKQRLLHLLRRLPHCLLPGLALLGMPLAARTPAVAATWPADTGRAEMPAVHWPAQLPVSSEPPASYSIKNKLLPAAPPVINRPQLLIGAVCVGVVGSALLLYGVRSR